MGDVKISFAITPSLPVKHDLILGGKKAGRFHEVAGVSTVDAGGPCSQ